MSKRPFRTAESLAFESTARDAVAPFLQSRGIKVLEERRQKTGTAVSQFVRAQLPDGDVLHIKVKLCWRRDGRQVRENLYSATQLRARRLEGGWSQTLEDIERKNRAQGVTHLLLFQRTRHTETHAALVPVDAVAPIWQGQFEASERAAKAGRLGRVKKNHAANGQSPTIWLQDDRSAGGPDVANVLWSWPGVVDLIKGGPLLDAPAEEDTYDDCPGLSSQAGSDGAPRSKVLRSQVKRDGQVRDLVRKRARGQCERCGLRREYERFLDVHHVMGAEKSDRVWTCVALCPNCHREAHVSPAADAIREELTIFAGKFRN